jgi:hypothetical protein
MEAIAYDCGVRDGAAEERTLIVAWLREQGCKGVNDIDTADCIETGEHLTCI